MKKIAIFNHKGGVSKTTTAFNLGWRLSRMGKRVLLIDADSQCNLSLYALGNNAFDEFYSSGNKNNIKDALEPAFKAKPKLIEAVECISIKRNENPQSSKFIPKENRYRWFCQRYSSAICRT